MIDRSELVRRYLKYSEAKARIRARQKQELEVELLPFTKDVGEAVIARQQSGDSVDVILDALGRQNKTFLYDAKRAAQGGVVTSTPDEVPEPAEGDLDPDGYSLTVAADGQEAEVDFGNGEVYFISIGKDYISAPDEWAGHSKERRAIYRKILTELSG